MNDIEKLRYAELEGRPQSEQKAFKISQESVLKMNQTIITRCNERVKEDDELFIIGDFGFKSGTGRGEGEPEKFDKYINQLVCKHVVWIEGNHDNAGRNGFKTIIRKVIVHYGGKNICLVHDPEYADVNYEMNLTAHVHNQWKIKRIKRGMQFTDCINVGIDVWNFYPITINEINQRYAEWLKNEK